MGTVQVYQLLKKRVLVTRESARAIQSELAHALTNTNGEVYLDFRGVEGLTPSFLDEMLIVIEESMPESPRGPLRLRLHNPPTRLSSKFAAVGRAHRLSIAQSDDGSWIISRNLEMGRHQA